MDDAKRHGEGSSWTARDGVEASFRPLQWPSKEQGGRDDATPVAQTVPGCGDDWSIFPPKEHEDLYVQHEFPIEEPSSSGVGGSDYANSAAGHWGLWDRRMFAERSRFTGLMRRLVHWGNRILCSRFSICTAKGVAGRGRGGGALRNGFWSITAFAVVALALLYMRRKHREERFRLLLLIHEKDKMIAELLQKIVQMNGRGQ